MELIKNLLIGFSIYFVIIFVGCGLLAIIWYAKECRSEAEQRKLDDEQMKAVSEYKKE